MTARGTYLYSTCDDCKRRDIVGLLDGRYLCEECARRWAAGPRPPVGDMTAPRIPLDGWRPAP